LIRGDMRKNDESRKPIMFEFQDDVKGGIKPLYKSGVGTYNGRRKWWGIGNIERGGRRGDDDNKLTVGGRSWSLDFNVVWVSVKSGKRGRRLENGSYRFMRKDGTVKMLSQMFNEGSRAIFPTEGVREKETRCENTKQPLIDQERGVKCRHAR